MSVVNFQSCRTPLLIFFCWQVNAATILHLLRACSPSFPFFPLLPLAIGSSSSSYRPSLLSWSSYHFCYLTTDHQHQCHGSARLIFKVHEGTPNSSYRNHPTNPRPHHTNPTTSPYLSPYLATIYPILSYPFPLNFT